MLYLSWGAAGGRRRWARGADGKACGSTSTAPGCKPVSESGAPLAALGRAQPSQAQVSQPGFLKKVVLQNKATAAYLGCRPCHNQNVPPSQVAEPGGHRKHPPDLVGGQGLVEPSGPRKPQSKSSLQCSSRPPENGESTRAWIGGASQQGPASCNDTEVHLPEREEQSRAAGIASSVNPSNLSSCSESK